jgi:uncharacterized protein YkwD
MDRRKFIGYGAALACTGLTSGALAWPGPEGPIPLAGALRRFSAARRAAGLTVPVRDGGLSASAWRQVLHMADQGAVSHFDAAGRDPNARARQEGFTGRVLGEALAETREGPEATMAFWLSHDPTREVLMEPGIRRFGLAAAASPDGRAWWLLATAA